MEMDSCFQRRESPLFLTTKMVNVTLRANQQLLYRGVTIHIPCDSIQFPLCKCFLTLTLTLTLLCVRIINVSTSVWRMELSVAMVCLIWKF